MGMHDTAPLVATIERMGAAVEITNLVRRRPRPGLRTETGHRVNVVERKGHETFDLRFGEDVLVDVIDARPDDRHLLMVVKDPADDLAARKYLLGHDERHWFVAGVPERARNVTHAKELLQPAEVRDATKRAGLVGRKGKHLKRHNPAYLRQGEWFFVPVPELTVSDREVHRNEPIRRGRSKPHICAEVYRVGGRQVFVCSHHPNGIPVAAAADHRERERCITARIMTIDAQVYARGAVRHPDHKTLQLKGWHRVYLSREVSSVSQAFLD